MHGDAGFVDGTMIAKKLPCYTSSNMGSLQYHGAHYLGPMQCKPCIDATPTACDECEHFEDYTWTR